MIPHGLREGMQFELGMSVLGEVVVREEVQVRANECTERLSCRMRDHVLNDGERGFVRRPVASSLSEPPPPAEAFESHILKLYKPHIMLSSPIVNHLHSSSYQV